MHFLEDSLIGTWLGSNEYTIATWTLSIELIASFFIYLLAFTSIKYRDRYWFYILPILAIWIAKISDGTYFTNYGIPKVVFHLP